jgi:PAS domain S-box-containing protein
MPLIATLRAALRTAVRTAMPAAWRFVFQAKVRAVVASGMARLGLTTRLMLASGSALLAGGGALLVVLTLADARRFQADLEQRASDELSTLAPMVGDAAVVGDHALIGQLLSARVQSPHLETIDWTDRRGATIRRFDSTRAGGAPAWFVHLVAFDAPERRQELRIGGVGYGELVVRMSAAPSIEPLWSSACTGAAILALAFAANLLLVFALVRLGLRPLTALRQGTRRLGAGDHSVRVVPSGPPEMRETIDVFNGAAEMIERLHVTLRGRELALRDARDDLESRVVERTAELEDKNHEFEAQIERGHMLVADLRTSEERFRTLTALSSDWFWEQDAELRFVQITEGVHNSGGIPREAHVGKTRWELPYTQAAAGDWGPHIADLLARRPFRDLLLRRTVPGNERWILVSGAPLFDADGTFTGYRGVARDVTQEKDAELTLMAARDAADAARKAADAASRAKSEFLANMSHEVRTPMNGILGMAGLLIESELPPREKHFARTVQRSAVALLKVINDILDFSKIEAGKLDLEEVDFDLRALLDETVQAFAGAADAKEIELACDTASLPRYVRGDPGRIRQVLSNLIGNAIKFTAQGEVVVAAVAEPDTDAADAFAAKGAFGALRIRFVVRDSGIGIDDEAMARIFEPFSQADGSTTRRYGGTGLGLTIARQLVRMMGGEIGVTSERGHGSTFWFTVVLGRSQRRAAGLAPVLEGRRVLVVDDSAVNLEILQHQLESVGIVARGVAGGAAALALLEARPGPMPFDLAILDVHMPGIDGLELAERIRARPHLDAMRLVMLSSVGRDQPHEHLRQLGVAAWLTKPVGTSALLHTLEEAFSAVPGGRDDAGDEGDEGAPDAELQFEGHVLLAEDNDVNRLVAISMLQTFGLMVDVAEDGRQAVALSARRRYDLVLMDCQMPEMDGFAATAAMRARDRGAARCVIVALTAHAMDGDRERCLAFGMDDYLSKPFQRADLARLLKRWIPRGPEFEALTLAGELDD